MKYVYLNQIIATDDSGYSDAWRRVLERLGDYTDIIVRALNMRPDEVVWLSQSSSHVLVRITTNNEHVVLRIAPEADLAGEVFFGRTLEAHRLPATRIIQHDLTRASVPFAYTLESYACGRSATQIDTPHLFKAAARQVGRTLRRMHRVAAPGWGRPTGKGRWTTPDWRSVLEQLHIRLAPAPTDALVFGDEERAAVGRLLEHPTLICERPVLLHGAVGPSAARCTIGEHVQLEAIVEPGPVLGGDGMFDLAWGLDPAQPAEWRAGLLEGYVALAPLTDTEQERLRILHLLTCYWNACYRYARAEPYEATRDQALALFNELQGCVL